MQPHRTTHSQLMRLSSLGLIKRLQLERSVSPTRDKALLVPL